MPEQSHPPYASGATTIPRTLIRWLDVNAQNGPLTRTATTITLPAFTGNGESWLGVSDIVTAFNFESPNNFSFQAIQGPLNPNYTLCVSYHVGGVMTRYALWIASGSVLNQDIPLYNGQSIKKNFRLEVWSTSQGNATQTKAITIYTSVAGTRDYRYGTDGALVNNDPQVSNFNCNLPFSGVSNPFYLDIDPVYFAFNGAIVPPHGVEITGLDGVSTLFGGGAFVGGAVTEGVYLTGTNGTTTNTIPNIYGTLLFGAFSIVITGGYGTLSFGSYAGSTFTPIFTINLGGTGRVEASGTGLGYTLSVGLPTNYLGLVIAVLSFKGAPNVITLDVYDENANLIGTTSHTSTSASFTDPSNQPCVQAVDSAAYFMGGGFAESLYNSAQIAQYVVNRVGFQLPLTFPSNAASTTN